MQQLKKTCCYYNLRQMKTSKWIHTEFADLVDTLTTQLKPTAVREKRY